MREYFWIDHFTLRKQSMAISRSKVLEHYQLKMKIKTIKLGTKCSDKATGQFGSLTHMLFNLDHHVAYVFQPHGLNPENGQPIKRFRIEEARLANVIKSDYTELDVPVEILGTEVEDSASGFKGTAIAFVQHPSGCFHVEIQPRGVVKSTNTQIASAEFDLRRCIGKKIPKLDPVELEKSVANKPSPTDDHVYAMD